MRDGRNKLCPDCGASVVLHECLKKGSEMSMREKIVEVLEGIFQRGYKHGVSSGKSNDGEFYAVDFGADRILAIVREGLPVRKKLDCGLSPHEIYNQALTDVIAKLEEV